MNAPPPRSLTHALTHTIRSHTFIQTTQHDTIQCNAIQYNTQTGEVLFWLGIYLAGAPSFGNSLVAWLASSAGLYGIVTIMVGAAARLEQRQAETYGGQDAYERWKFKVPGALIPFVQKDYAKKKD